MTERTDPAHAGVRAGRVVGVLTALVVAGTLLGVQDSFYRFFSLLIEAFGVEFVPVSGLFWGNAALAAIGRYSFTYVVGSLIGVVYDWLDDPPLSVLVGIVLVVGAVDGAVGWLDSRSLAVAGAYVVAWLCYVPVFVRLYDEEATAPSGPRRLGD